MKYPSGISCVGVAWRKVSTKPIPYKMNLTYSDSEIERAPYGIPSIDGSSLKFEIEKSIQVKSQIEILNTKISSHTNGQ